MAQKQSADLQASIAQQEEDAARLKDKLETAQMDSFAYESGVNQLLHTLTNRNTANPIPATTNAKPANALAEMFKNPEIWDIIKKQQKSVMGRGWWTKVTPIF